MYIEKLVSFYRIDIIKSNIFLPVAKDVRLMPNVGTNQDNVQLLQIMLRRKLNKKINYKWIITTTGC